MIALLLLAGISRCAVATLCPSNAELARAIYREAEAEASAVMEAEANNPNDLVLAMPYRVRHVEDVHCGAAEPDGGSMIECNFTARLGPNTMFEVAQLERRDGEWTVVKVLSVSRH